LLGIPAFQKSNLGPTEVALVVDHFQFCHKMHFKTG